MLILKTIRFQQSNVVIKCVTVVVLMVITQIPLF